MNKKKAVTLCIRLPEEVANKLYLYVKAYDREVCASRESYTDVSKVLRAIIVTLLFKKGLVGYEYVELTDPCYNQYAKPQ